MTAQPLRILAMGDLAPDSHTAMRVEASGFGAGTRDLAELPNLTQVVVGTTAGTSADGYGDGWAGQPVVLVEANVDDATGEALADAVTALDEDALVYSEVDAGNCTFGSIFATDGRVGALGLTVLEDDEGFFPPFNGSLTVRADVLEANPELEELFAPISEVLDDETMVELNAQVPRPCSVGEGSSCGETVGFADLPEGV